MQTPLELAWREWEAFCHQVQESVATGIPPQLPEYPGLRTALTSLSPEALESFLDDPRLEERHPAPEKGDTPLRFAMLLCFLPQHAALLLAERYDDPCRAKSNLPPRPRLVLFLTFRWKAFLLENLHREMSVLSLQAARFHINHFVERFGGDSAKALLKTNDSPTLTRELVKARKHFPNRTKL